MPSTTSCRQGDIVLVSFPFTDFSSAKKRPAVVVSPDSYNARGGDVVLAAITSQVSDERHTVIVRAGDYVAGALPTQSMVKLSKLFTIHSDLIIRKLCRLKPEKRAEVLAAVRDFFQ